MLQDGLCHFPSGRPDLVVPFQGCVLELLLRRPRVLVQEGVPQDVGQLLRGLLLVREVVRLLVVRRDPARPKSAQSKP